MNKDTERAFDVVCRAIKHNRYMVHTICAAYLGCDPDDVVLRCKKKNGGFYAKSESGADAASRFNKADS